MQYEFQFKQQKRFTGITSYKHIIENIEICIIKM